MISAANFNKFLLDRGELHCLVSYPRSRLFRVGEPTKQRLLREAAKLIGETELAVRLGIPVTLLRAWTKGHAHMPDRKLGLLADVLDEFSRPG
jgi:hypothetical protein